MKEKLLKLLGIKDVFTAIINLHEAVGELVLCIHWLRGTFNWMVTTGAVKFSSKQDEDNFWRLFKTIELYESFIWEIVPSRAALVGLRDLRSENPTITVEEIESLLIQDSHGRMPFDTTEEEADDIQDLLRRLGETRIARSKNLSHDKRVK